MASKDIDQMMLEAEPIVRFVVRRFSNRRIGGDDFAQELRIHLLLAARKFDSDQSKWSTYADFIAKRRAVDICRSYGELHRDGRRKRAFEKLESELMPADEDERYTVFDSPDHGDHEGEVDWADLEDVARSRGKYTLAAYWRASGLSLKEIGNRIGVGESRVGQILGDGSRARALHELVR